MPHVTIPLVSGRRLNRWQHAVNGLIVPAMGMRQVADATNFAARQQRKMVFGALGNMRSIYAGASSTRWRWRCMTGKLARRFVGIFVFAKDNHGAAASNGYAGLEAKNLTTAVTTSVRAYAGANTSAGVSVYDTVGELAVIRVYLDCDAATEYECLIEQADNGRLQSACVYEEAKLATTENGYIEPGRNVFEPIFDAHMQAVAELQTDLWTYNGAQLLAWSADGLASALTTSSATARNIIDNSSTTVTVNTPGFRLPDADALRRVSEPSVKAKLCAYGSMSAGTGSVALKNSAGSTLATVSGISTTPGWFTTSVDLTGAAAKHDIHFAASGGTLTLRAVSLYLAI